MKSVCQIIVGILKQLSDESAYERYLATHGLTHSPEEYRRFSDHYLKAKYTKAKCC